MSVYKRGDIWHYDYTHKGERQRGSTGFRKKKDAEEFVEAHRRALVMGIAPPGEVPTVGDLADKWFASRISGKKTATTVAQRLKILFRHLDRNTPINQVSQSVIEDAILSRRREPIRQGSTKNPRAPAPATVNRDMIDTTLRPILAYADEMEHPVKRIKWKTLRLAEPKGRTPIYDPAQMAGWRNGLPEWHRPLFDFIARYGVRLQEAFFHPDDVKADTFEIVLQDTKNGINHTLTILEDDMPALAARKTRAAEAGLKTIWFTDEGGKLTPIHWRAFQSASRKAMTAAGIKGGRPVHDLRHHAATTLARDSGSLRLVQKLLNHQTITSSARYSHATADDLRTALRHAHATKSETPKKKPSRVKDVPGVGTVT